MRTVTSWFMIAVLAVTLFVGGIVLQACAAFQKAAPFLPPPEDVACILSEVEANDTDPATVASKCNLVAWVLDDIVRVIEGGKLAKAKRLGVMKPDAKPDAGK